MNTTDMTDEAQVDIEAQESGEQALTESNIIGIMKGQEITEMPTDLYIPPDALEVILEAFEGPLDLLLYLIKKHNLDILDIPISHITYQYTEYINLMTELRLELAAEYLLMAAMLAEIKSRMLLPQPKTEDEDEVDPRAELIRRLQVYEQFKKASENLATIPRHERDVFPVTVEPELDGEGKPEPQVSMKDISLAFFDIMRRAKNATAHTVMGEPLSVRERMTHVLDYLNEHKFVTFPKLFHHKEGRMGVVVTFIALLELWKQATIEIVQTEPFSPIHVKLAEQQALEA